MSQRRGFTLIELLVVISIIALLASVILSSLSSARDKAKYTAVVQSLKQTEVALHLLRNDRSCWPREGSTACGGVSSSNPTVASLVSSGSFGLSPYLSSAPQWPFSSDVWHYDNDGDSAPDSCTAYTNAGINLFMDNVDVEQYRALNTIIDGDSNPDTTLARGCGKLRFSSSGTTGTVIYVISAQQD